MTSHKESPEQAGPAGVHDAEPHLGSLSSRLNWLRAGVLGANDGIVSVAGLVVGVAAATTDRGPILTAGLAGLAAGAVSMALGVRLREHPARHRTGAAGQGEARAVDHPRGRTRGTGVAVRGEGLSSETARKVAEELTEHDAFAAHAEAELGIDPNELTNPWQAAGASAISFTVGAILPMLAILLPPATARIPVTFVAVLVALAITGSLSARLGGARRSRAVLRVVTGGALAMAVTYGIGQLLGLRESDAGSTGSPSSQASNASLHRQAGERRSRSTAIAPAGSASSDSTIARAATRLDRLSPTWQWISTGPVSRHTFTHAASASTCSNPCSALSYMRTYISESTVCRMSYCSHGYSDTRCLTKSGRTSPSRHPPCHRFREISLITGTSNGRCLCAVIPIRC
ncbi:hypothetical protein GS931_01220 [Rhodococcus hoagii]|nr:hypothetical protein [Prescottella equi]